MGQFTRYDSQDSGAPTLSGTAGDLVTMLTAILVNGYTASVTSITRSGSTATVTTATAHRFTTGNQTTIAGAAQTEYNGTFTVTVTGATTFTITVSGTPATPATGTITWKKLAAGWTKPLTGTNKAAFKAGAGNQFYLRVQDDAPASATTARVRGYETMSDVDTGTGLFPTVAQLANGMFVRKSAAANVTTRAWVAFADDRTLYLGISTGDTAGVYYGYAFGDFYSLVNSDGFRTMILADITENTGSGANGFATLSYQLINFSGHYMARAYTGLGTAVGFGKHVAFGEMEQGGSTGSGTMVFPTADGGIYLSPFRMDDASTSPAKSPRGYLRGMWVSAHSGSGFADGDTFTGTGDLAGKTFYIMKSMYNGTAVGHVIFETSNTVLTNS